MKFKEKLGHAPEEVEVATQEPATEESTETVQDPPVEKERPKL